jgi:galactokinase
MSGREAIQIALRLDARPELRLTPYIFDQLFGGEPSGIWRAPVGLTLAGGVTAPSSLAIPLMWGAIVAARRRDDAVIDLRSANFPAEICAGPPESLDEGPEWATPALKIISALVDSDQAPPGTTLMVRSTLPNGFDLPSDSAVQAAVAAAFDELYGLRVPVDALATMDYRAEQQASQYCPDGFALLVDGESLVFEEIEFDLEHQGLRLVALGLGPVEEDQDAVMDVLAAAEHLRSGRLEDFARMFGSSAGGEPAGRLVEAAVGAGALGARVVRPQVSDNRALLLAFVRAAQLGTVRKGLTRVWQGSAKPRFLTATSSRGGAPVVARPGYSPQG